MTTGARQRAQLRCRGCNERIDATHWGWCPVGEYATGVSRAECEPADAILDNDPGPEPEAAAARAVSADFADHANLTIPGLE